MLLLIIAESSIQPLTPQYTAQLKNANHHPPLPPLDWSVLIMCVYFKSKGGIDNYNKSL